MTNENTPAVTDEMKAFLQEGLKNYAPALVALSEFRGQIRIPFRRRSKQVLAMRARVHARH
jgi:hypothetical protein